MRVIVLYIFECLHLGASVGGFLYPTTRGPRSLKRNDTNMSETIISAGCLAVLEILEMSWNFACPLKILEMYLNFL